MNKTKEIACPHCHSHFFIKEGSAPRVCPFCSTLLQQDSESIGFEEVSFVEGHAPPAEEVQFAIGPYQIIKSIGKGGMGEVFLAYDTTCGRRIALKQIRTDLKQHKNLFQRFLKEARITSQLTHPSIIPIYAIHEEGDLIYYTMPFVEGKTLKEIIRQARKAHLKGERIEDAASIPALIRILLQVSQAIAYAHSHHVLHRDIKPENIIIGKFGEVMILDWGLAKVIDHEEETLPETQGKRHATRLGKVVGTVSYMAPERGMGHPATLQTDLYSLGVILYWMLTLRPPFQRGTLEEFRKNMEEEELSDPAAIAPHRDVPPLLSQICKRCLEPNPADRYQTVESFVHDLQNYIEGRSDWYLAASLNVLEKNDWEFQENVFIGEHVAISQEAEISEWVSLMISKHSFAENLRLKTRVKLGSSGYGVGFLLAVPEASERKHLNDGYCIWIGSEEHHSTKILRSTVEVLQAPEVFLKDEEWYEIRIEKEEGHIHFYLNQVLQFSYISHLPLAGTHIGILAKDGDYEMEDIEVYTGSQNITLSCLAVPDAFLAHKDYEKALTEYRRIANAFPGRMEGREALFRAGVTLLERGKHDSREPSDLESALAEFEKLHSTPGAPLEYLGKGLVYKMQGDFSEEIKCYALAYRRYPGHPLLHVLQEQVVYRMHECSRAHRHATYELILLVNRHIPEVARAIHSKKLFSSLKNQWEPLPFLLKDGSNLEASPLMNLSFSTSLCFWLKRGAFLEEILDELLNMSSPSKVHIGNALHALLELQEKEKIPFYLEKLKEKWPEEKTWNFIQLALDGSIDNALEKTISNQTDEAFRTLFYLFEKEMFGNEPIALSIRKKLEGYPLSHHQLPLDVLSLYNLLYHKKWKEAAAIFSSYPMDTLSKESSPLHFLYGCLLAATEGQEIAMIQFSNALHTPFPRSWTLGIHFLLDYLTPFWWKEHFAWEKKRLYQQLYLYYTCTNQPKLASHAHYKLSQWLD